jgi:YhcH/YjgK/YiaL family protein
MAMIVDRLGNRSVDVHVPPRVGQALEYLRTTDMAAVPLGRHEIDGEHLFALVQEYQTRPAADCVWEAHRRYVDVQYIVRGAERMGHAVIADMVPRQPYDAQKDVALFEPGSRFVTLTAGMFAIFGPNDVHSPCVAADRPQPVRKVVVKAEI